MPPGRTLYHPLLLKKIKRRKKRKERKEGRTAPPTLPGPSKHDLCARPWGCSRPGEPARPRVARALGRFVSLGFVPLPLQEPHFRSSLAPRRVGTGAEDWGFSGCVGER